jgi:hypothetical protein
MQYIWDVSNPRTYNNRSGCYKFQRERGFIVNHGANPLERILDIGGGSGRYAVDLERYYTNPRSWRSFPGKLANSGDGTTANLEMPYTDQLAPLHDCGLEVDAVEGMNRMPFRLSSNSRLVTLSAAIEEVSGLKHWHAQNLWLLLSLRRAA